MRSFSVGLVVLFLFLGIGGSYSIDMYSGDNHLRFVRSSESKAQQTSSGGTVVSVANDKGVVADNVKVDSGKSLKESLDTAKKVLETVTGSDSKKSSGTSIKLSKTVAAPARFINKYGDILNRLNLQNENVKLLTNTPFTTKENSYSKENSYPDGEGSYSSNYPTYVKNPNEEKFFKNQYSAFSNKFDNVYKTRTKDQEAIRDRVNGGNREKILEKLKKPKKYDSFIAQEKRNKNKMSTDGLGELRKYQTTYDKYGKGYPASGRSDAELFSLDFPDWATEFSNLGKEYVDKFSPYGAMGDDNSYGYGSKRPDGPGPYDLPPEYRSEPPRGPRYPPQPAPYSSGPYPPMQYQPPYPMPYPRY